MNLKKHLRRIILTLLAAALLLLIAFHFVSNYVEDKARNILSTIPINASTVDANILTRSIELGSVDWTQPNDSLPQFPHHMLVNKVRLEGISIYQLLKKDKLHIHKVLFDVGEFQLNQGLKSSKTDSAEIKISLKGLTIDRLVVKDVYVKVFTDSVDQYEGIVNLSLDKVALTDFKHIRELTSYGLGSFDALITNVSIKGEKDMYNKTIAKIYANSVDSKVEIDSVLFVPKYSKYQFSRKLGRQADRMNVMFPKISINGLDFTQLKDSLFKAASIEIKSAKLHVYKDKRLPFIKEKTTPLPIEMIRDFKLALAIDTIKITDANITYEEFPEKGYNSGKVTFERLNATLDHLTNRDHFPDYKQATLKASSYIMGKGLLKAEFSLPYGKSQVYNAKGTLVNFYLYRLNPMLENLAFVSITSGKLNQLTFNFDYTDAKSNGTVIVNYEDLKLNSLTKEKNSEKNEIKSFVINAILKKNKTGKTEKEKRTGTVDFERDRRRAIFHYWWRSLLTGIKSSAVELPNNKKKNREE